MEQMRRARHSHAPYGPYAPRPAAPAPPLSKRELDAVGALAERGIDEIAAIRFVALRPRGDEERTRERARRLAGRMREATAGAALDAARLDRLARAAGERLGRRLFWEDLWEVLYGDRAAVLDAAPAPAPAPVSTPAPRRGRPEAAVDDGGYDPEDPSRGYVELYTNLGLGAAPVRAGLEEILRALRAHASAAAAGAGPVPIRIDLSGILAALGAAAAGPAGPAAPAPPGLPSLPIQVDLAGILGTVRAKEEAARTRSAADELLRVLQETLPRA